MTKFPVYVLFMLIAGIYAASSCGSCGSECASACGTRRFRTCCFNYLRRKRTPEAVEFLMPITKELKKDDQDKFAMMFLKSLPDAWYSTNDFNPYIFEDTMENHILNE